MKHACRISSSLQQVRNAQLKLAGDKDVCFKKRGRVIHDLSNAYSSVVRSYEVAQVALEATGCAHEQLAIPS